MRCVQHPSPPGPVIRQGGWYQNQAFRAVLQQAARAVRLRFDRIFPYWRSRAAAVLGGMEQRCTSVEPQGRRAIAHALRRLWKGLTQHRCYQPQSSGVMLGHTQGLRMKFF